MANLIKPSSVNSSAFKKQNEYDDDEPYEMINDPDDLNDQPPPIEKLIPLSNLQSLKEPTSPNFLGTFGNMPYKPSNTKVETTTTTNLSLQQTNIPATTIAAIDNNTDYIKQLTNKIRKQAERLMFLENYLNLCERRICELCPNHPLPVLISHLGMNNNMNEVNGENGKIAEQIEQCEKVIKAKDEEIKRLMMELNENKLKNDNHHQLLNEKYQQACDDKLQLENSLRNETLYNEEQRAYIQTLKAMLEEKLDKYGLTRFYIKNENNKVDLVLELKNLQEEIAKLTNELKTKDQELQKLKNDNTKLNQKHQDLLNENLQLSETNIKLNQGIKACESEIAKIEEEKSNLLDYIDKNSAEFEKATQENVDLLKKCATLAEELKIADDKYSNAYNTIKKLEDLLSNYQQELNDVISKYEDAQSEMKNLQDQTTNLKNTVDHYNKKLITAEKHYKSLKEQDLINKGRLKECREELEGYKQILKTKEGEYEDSIASTYRAHKAEIDSLQEKLNEMKGRDDVLKNLLDLKENEINKNLDEVTQLKEENEKLIWEVTQFKNKGMKSRNGMRSDIEDNQGLDEYYIQDNKQQQRVNKEREMKLGELKKYIDQNKSLREEIHKLKEEIITGVNNFRAKDNELALARTQLEKKSQLIQNLTKESQGYKDKHDAFCLVKAFVENFKYGQEMDLANGSSLESDDLGESELTSVDDVMGIALGEPKVNEAARWVLASIKDIYKQSMHYQQENQRLEKKFMALESKLKQLTEGINERDTRFNNLNQTKDDLEHQLTKVNQELNEVLTKQKALIDEKGYANKALDDLKKEREQISNVLSTQQKKLYNNVNGMLKKSPKNQGVLSIKMKNFLESYEISSSLVGLDGRFCEIITTMINILSEEYEKLLKKLMETNQDLSTTIQKMQNGDNMNNTNSYMDETQVYPKSGEIMIIDNNKIQKEYGQAQREYGKAQKELDKGQKEYDRPGMIMKETKHEKQNSELRQELRNLNSEFQKKNEMYEMIKAENEEIKKELQEKLIVIEIYINEKQDLEERYNLITRRNIHLQEIIEKIIGLLSSNPEVKSIIEEVYQIQLEMNVMEEEKHNVEKMINQIQKDHESILTKGAIIPNKSIQVKNDLENYEDQTKEIINQLAKLKKKKSALLNKLKAFETLENPSYYHHDYNNNSNNYFYTKGENIDSLRASHEVELEPKAEIISKKLSIGGRYADITIANNNANMDKKRDTGTANDRSNLRSSNRRAEMEENQELNEESPGVNIPKDLDRNTTKSNLHIADDYLVDRDYFGYTFTLTRESNPLHGSSSIPINDNNNNNNKPSQAMNIISQGKSEDNITTRSSISLDANDNMANKEKSINSSRNSINHSEHPNRMSLKNKLEQLKKLA